MKILLLNPHIDAGHDLLKGLQAKGLAVLLPANAEEAWQMLQLHGTSVDIAVIHREEGTGTDNESGLKFLPKFKTDASQADLPVIVTSHQWGDTDFARHQDSPQGVNAYLKWPFGASELISLMEAVFGSPIESPAQASPPFQPPAASKSPLKSTPPPPKAPAVSDDGSGLVLEDASQIFSPQADYEASDTSIRLEAPEFEGSDAALLAAVPEAPSFGSVSIPTASEISALETNAQGIDLGTPAQDPPQIVNVAPVQEDASIIVEFQAEEASRQTLAEEPDHQTSQEMPYLFQQGQSRGFDPSAAFGQPLGDAVVPGGAAQTPDAETLKKYLLLREQDVAVLSSQLKAAKDQIKSLEDTLREERARNAELTHVSNEQKRKIEEFDKEKRMTEENLQAEISELKFQLKARSDKGRNLESQVREAAEEMERLKDRVRSDIRKIRVREKELENRLEIMKKDSEALIGARENKIIELKRKLDLLEFNMDLLQDQHSREKENAAKLRERLAKAAQVVRVAGGLLDNPGAASKLASALGAEGTDGKDAA